MKYIGTYSNDTDIATKAKVDAKQDKVLANGILQGDGAGTISAAETQEVELVELTKADVGLGNVDNTSDANKPISTATQTALNGKQATITGGATTITSSNLAANRALVSDANGKVAVSEVTGTELGYLDGVTSNIQTQLDSKLSAAPVTSVNSKTGAVVLSASDVGALSTTGGNMTGNIYFVNDTGTNYGFAGIANNFLFMGYSARNGVMFKSNAVHFNGTADFTNTTLQGINAADVNAVGLEGDQTIDGSKTFTGEAKFDLGFTAGGSTFTGGCIFSGQQGFNDGMIVGGETYYKENSYISGKIHYDEDSTVDFTNATVSGLKGLLPTVNTSNNGQFLRVVNGEWAAATVENANGVSF